MRRSPAPRRICASDSPCASRPGRGSSAARATTMTWSSFAVTNMLTVGAGHSFIVFLREGYPVNVLNAVKSVPEACRIFCATANPVEVVVGETDQGRSWTMEARPVGNRGARWR